MKAGYLTVAAALTMVISICLTIPLATGQVLDFTDEDCASCHDGEDPDVVAVSGESAGLP